MIKSAVCAFAFFLAAPGARAATEDYWDTRITPHFIFHYQARRIDSRYIADIETVHRLLKHEFWSLGNKLQTDKIDFFLYSNKPSFERGKFHPPQGAAGIAFRTGAEVKNWIFVTYEGVPLALIAHEVTHLFFRAFYADSSDQREPPRWLNEGLAVAMENDITSKMGRPKEGVPRIVTTLIPMNRFMDPGSTLASGEWYAQAGSVVRYLRQGKNSWKFVRFCKELAQGASVERALHDNYGFRHLGELERAWQKWLKQSSQPGATPSSADTSADADISSQFKELP